MQAGPLCKNYITPRASSILLIVTTPDKMYTIRTPSDFNAASSRANIGVLFDIPDDELRKPTGKWSTYHLLGYRVLLETNIDTLHPTGVLEHLPEWILEPTPRGLSRTPDRDLAQLPAGTFWSALAKAIWTDPSDQAWAARAERRASLRSVAIEQERAVVQSGLQRARPATPTTISNQTTPNRPHRQKDSRGSSRWNRVRQMISFAPKKERPGSETPRPNISSPSGLVGHFRSLESSPVSQLVTRRRQLEHPQPMNNAVFSSSPLSPSSSDSQYTDQGEYPNEDHLAARRGLGEEITVQVAMEFLRHVVDIFSMSIDLGLQKQIFVRWEKFETTMVLGNGVTTKSIDDGGIALARLSERQGWVVPMSPGRYLARVEAKRGFGLYDEDPTTGHLMLLMTDEVVAQYIGEAVTVFNSDDLGLEVDQETR